jgi:hypothetical protein
MGVDNCDGCKDIMQNAEKYWDGTPNQKIRCSECGTTVVMQTTQFHMSDPELEAQLRRYMHDMLIQHQGSVSEEEAAEIERAVKAICLEAELETVKN